VQKGVRFVQITDVHLFDSGKRCFDANVNREYRENLAALEWAIRNANEINAASRTDKAPEVDFVAFTGDFGLENVVEPGEPPLSKPKSPTKPTPCFPDETVGSFYGPVEPISIETAASQVASIFGQLAPKIRIFLVPGNNDLKDENPGDVSRYIDFVTALERYLPGRVRDLTNLAGPQTASPAPIIADTLHLLGLNTASFKISDSEKNISLRPLAMSAAPVSKCGSAQFLVGEELPGNGLSDRMPERSSNLLSLQKQVADLQGAQYILFTHVPDVVDPFSSIPADCANSTTGGFGGATGATFRFAHEQRATTE
jgi:3',5'-cyclic AMP phosphodiesterase CpdA